MTDNKWHVTHDTWCRVNILSKFQLSSSNGLGDMMLWIYGGKGSLTQWIINDVSVCRTALATLGLLKKKGFSEVCHQTTAVQLVLNPLSQFIPQLELYSQLQMSLLSNPISFSVPKLMWWVLLNIQGNGNLAETQIKKWWKFENSGARTK